VPGSLRPTRLSRRLGPLVGLLLVSLLLLAVVPASRVSAVGDPTIAAAGDIACDPTDAAFNGGAGTRRCHMLATSQLIGSLGVDGVLPLGDTQYDDGQTSDFHLSYDPTWGRFLTVSHPVVGNHEYSDPQAAGYFAYFGPAAGAKGQGYYSFDVGSWHLIALNANCGKVGGCGAGSAQEKWLRSDLAAHPTACTLAYWHQPRFSSARQGGSPATAAFWQDLYTAGAELVLNGHHHHYERFAAMNPSGGSDAAHGIREFIVGTGGESLVGFGTILPTSEARAVSYGVLALTLHPSSYDWRFVAETGATLDAGSGTCHAP
jgi:hypothetical protein